MSGLARKIEAPVRSLEEGAEALKSAILKAVIPPVQDENEAIQRSSGISNILSIGYDGGDVVEQLYELNSRTVEPVNHGNHYHSTLFTDGIPREGRFAAVSKVEAGEEEKPEFHGHPDNTIEHVILGKGTLSTWTEGKFPEPIHGKTPQESVGKHTVLGGRVTAYFVCIRYIIAPHE